MKKQGATIKWSPIDIFTLDPSKVIFNGRLQIYKEDPHDGETAHGTTGQAATTFGVVQEDVDNVEFFCALPTDRYHRLDIDLAHTIGGAIEAEEYTTPKQYKARAIVDLLHLESTKVDYKKIPERWVEGCPKKYKYFQGIGRVMFVPWTSMKAIPIHYFVHDNVLVWMSFSLTFEEYTDWRKYVDLFKKRMIYGNSTLPKDVL
jgi:hypothetical protein